jgi:hypothetical protein
MNSTTVTYGTAPASFLATRCLQQLALEDMERFPKASEVLCSSFYLDDFLGGCSMPEEAMYCMNCFYCCPLVDSSCGNGVPTTLKC